MARPIDETTTTDPRPGAVRDDATTTRSTGANTSLRDTELKRHRGGSTLWIILAVILAVLLALWLFSGAFSSNPGVGTDVEAVPGAAVDGAVTTEPVVPGGTTIDGNAVGTDTAPAPADATPAPGVVGN